MDEDGSQLHRPLVTEARSWNPFENDPGYSQRIGSVELPRLTAQQAVRLNKVDNFPTEDLPLQDHLALAESILSRQTRSE